MFLFESDRRLVRELEEAHYRRSTDKVVDEANRMRSSMPLYDRLGYPERVDSLDAFRALPLLTRDILHSQPPSALVPKGETWVGAIASGRYRECASSGRDVTVLMGPDDGGLMPLLHALVMQAPMDALKHHALLTSPICSGTSCELTGDELFAVLPPTSNVFAEDDDYVRRVHAAAMRLTRPATLIANPVVLAEVVRRGVRLGLSMPDDLVILSTYQRLPIAIGRTLAKHFEHGPFEQYGASELAGRYVSNGCAQGNHHVWAANAYVEILGDDGVEVAPGELGHVVITNLGASGTQLLRYKVGDLGRLTRGPCACGMADTELLRIEGRAADGWRTPTGWITEAVVDEALSQVPGMALHQLTRTGAADYRLTVIADDGFRDDDAMGALEPLLEARPSVVRRSSIEVTHRQKYPTLRNVAVG